MALSIDDLNAMTSEALDGVITKQIYDSMPFLAVLKRDKQVKLSGGTLIEFPIRYRKYARAGSVTARQQVVFQSKETRTAAQLNFKYYLVDGLMHWDERRANQGKSQTVDLLQDKSQELSEDMSDVIATAIFAASPGTNDIDSIPKIVDTSDPYGGIAVADAAAWAAGNEDNSQTVLKLYGSASLSYAQNQATLGANHPTLHITTRDIFTTYESRLQPQQVYEDKSMVNLGFESLKFRNKPVVADSFCPAGDWYGLDMKEWFLVCDPDYAFTPSKWFSLEQAGFPHALGKVVSFAGNLKCRRRKTNFKFTAIDYTS